MIGMVQRQVTDYVRTSLIVTYHCDQATYSTSLNQADKVSCTTGVM